MGKGKSPSEAAQEHQSTPLSALKDPASFGPPPKRIHYHGAAAPSASPATGGLDAPLSQGESSANERLQARKEAQAKIEEEANKPPPGPYKINTTGLSTNHLPKPPVSRGHGAPPSADGSSKPKLPPRLPPRQNSHPDLHAPPPPPPYSETSPHTAPSHEFLNQGALSRLGKAGVSVPGLDIGRTASPPLPPRRTSSHLSAAPVSPAATSNGASQVNELQSRFARMSASSPVSQNSTTGTSWAEKQAALKTANQVRTDPSKVSFSDMRAAASTANNFRERHGEQAASGWRAASGLSQKYGRADTAGNPPSPSLPGVSPSLPKQGGLGKKPPPPPPPKKKELLSNLDEPPPIPLGSKPRF
jgi:hypothetical protein